MARKKLKLVIGISFLIVFVATTFAPVAARTRKVATLEFIVNCQVAPEPNQLAYVDNPGVVETAFPTLGSTIAAFRTIKIINGITGDYTSNFTNFKLFMDQLRDQNEGGFRDYDDDDINETLKCTYQGISFFDMFNENEKILPVHMEFTNKSQNVNNSGYGPNPSSNSTPDLINTYYALKIYELNESLESNRSRVADFVKSCQIQPGNDYEYLFGISPNSTEPSLIATSMAVALFKSILTGVYDNITNDLAFRPAVEDYLSQGLVQGGGGGIKDPVQPTPATLSSTYWALMLSKNIDDILLVYYEDIESWIISKQKNDGGFVEGDTSESSASSSMEATFHAIASLKFIDSQLSAIEAEFPWDLDQDVLMITIVVLLIVIVVILILFYMYKKKNRI
ncbi:MAG: hypothetical protein ACFFCS_13620 [Candidatus Hodarchaeota archaeon]